MQPAGGAQPTGRDGKRAGCRAIRIRIQEGCGECEVWRVRWWLGLQMALRANSGLTLCVIETFFQPLRVVCVFVCVCLCLSVFVCLYRG